MTLHLDMYQTLASGTATLLLGFVLNRKMPFLRRLCIPAPVSGGLAVSAVFLILHCLFGFEVDFDWTLKDLCMVIFFTTVGFQSDLSVLRRGGRPLVVLVMLVAVLIVIQNLTGVGIARLMGRTPLLGMSAGSITMCGGHGTAAGFSALLESQGLAGAASITMATATFGILAGSLIGGPLADFLIRRRGLAKNAPSVCESSQINGINDVWNDNQSHLGYAKAACVIAIAAGLGTLLNKLLTLAGLTFPTYFGALITAVIIRNVSEAVPSCPEVPIREVTSIGIICLSLFLGMAMISIRLWELAGIALPLLVILVAQVVLMILFSVLAAFPLLGRTYDAAVLVGGLCGFGLGATPNAMANMSAICTKYRYTTMPFIVIPIIGAMFADIINIGIITLFLNLI